MATEAETVRRAYLTLIRTFPLRPVKSDRELDLTIKSIDALLDRG